MTLTAALAVALVLPPVASPAPAALPNPCSLPGVDSICDAVGHAAAGAASDAADYVMRSVTTWVTDTAVWVTGKVGDLIDQTTSPNVEAGWFQGQYQAMLTVAGALALPLLILAVIQAVWRQDVWILLRSAFGYLPLAFILAAAAIVTTQLLIGITDDLSGIVVGSLGTGTSSDLLQSVGSAYTQALNDSSNGAVPLFGIFLGAIILAIGAFVLWLEMVIRDAAVYIALFFLPLTFVAMIWPATSRWARRLVELLIAIVLAKFVIVSIISLASAAITNTTLANTSSTNGGGGGGEFERMIAGSALLVLAAWSPFALLRLIPMMEAAAATVTGQRSSMSNAAGSAGIQSPAAYMRQAIDRHSRSSEPTQGTGTTRAVYTPQTSGSSGEAPAGRSEGSPATGGRPGSAGRVASVSATTTVERTSERAATEQRQAPQVTNSQAPTSSRDGPTSPAQPPAPGPHRPPAEPRLDEEPGPILRPEPPSPPRPPKSEEGDG